MTKQSGGISLAAQNAVEGRTPHYRAQAERPEKTETQIQARAA